MTKPQTQPRGTVLVVDDEPLLLRAFARVLMRAGHEVHQASDGAEAQALIAKRRFDVAFVDLGLPGAGGLEVLARLRANDPGLPVVLMTGAPTLETAIDAVAAGALRYLVKPIDTPELLQAANDAIRARHRDGDERHDRRHRDDTAMNETLDRALASLYMVFQPIVRCGRREVYAYEALVRTREPQVPHAGALIDMATQAGRLVDLGRRVRRAVAEKTASAAARIFVNLHPVDLADDDLYDPQAPLSRIARRVVLEVTERAGLDEIPDLGERLRRLRALGFRVAIDDLGEGYAGLTSLARVAPEFVKLDMSLVRGIDGCPTQRHIVASTVQLCRALGSEVVAEGVETAAERDALVALGLDLLQGYLIAKPAPELQVPSLS
jgi:EAL domain-containing protein (putative c-di-GMP-specific phosphodiesterase class I)/CheY-like chemotaxis protein